MDITVRVFWCSDIHLDMFIKPKGKIVISKSPPLRSKNKRISNFLGWLKRETKISGGSKITMRYLGEFRVDSDSLYQVLSQKYATDKSLYIKKSIMDSIRRNSK